MKSGHAWETERSLMRGKKLLSHCCFSWSTGSRIVPGKLAAGFAIPSKQELSILYIQGNSYMMHVGWMMHHRHCTDSSFHMSKSGSKKCYMSIHRYQLLSSSSAGITKRDCSIYASTALYGRAHTQNKTMMKNVRDAADCIKDMYSGSFNIPCFVNTIKWKMTWQKREFHTQ